MRRTIVLGVIILSGVVASAILGAQQGAAPAGQGRQAGAGGGGGRGGPPVQAIEKVKDNLYLIQGQGGNTAVYVAQSGVVIVDTKNPNNGQAILDQIKTVTDKPVTHIINTHTHGDHNGSNVFFPASVEIVVQENTKGYMEKMPAFQEAANKNGLPDRTFKDKMSVLKGKDQIDLYYFGAAHTGGDAFVVFKNLRVMHAGDAFANKGFPLIDRANGGSGAEYSKTLAKAIAGIRNIDTIIPGHNPVSTPADLQQYQQYTADLFTQVEAAAKAGKDANAAFAGLNLTKYTGYRSDRVKGAVDAIYAELGK